MAISIVRLFAAAGVFIGAAIGAQPNPVPFVNNPLRPVASAPGGAAFTLTVSGTGFDAGSVVNWNGSPRATAFVNGFKLTASILATDIAAAGTASVTVTNPAPGGGTSNVVFFSVTAAQTTAFTDAGSLQAFQPLGSTTADFNRDGKLDLAIPGVNPSNGFVVLLGNGDGTFQPPATFLTNRSPEYLVTGDFNNDGNLDIVGTDNSGTGVSVLLGNGDGTFGAFKEYATANDPYAIAVGDFNSDGKLDLAVGGYTSSSGIFVVSILLGNGDGSFQNHVDFPLMSSSVSSIVIGDFNRDGRLDLAVGTPSGTEILLGNGDGTFQNPTLISGPYTYITSADFNGDGILDLAAAGTAEAYILLGKGDGTFRPAVGYKTGRYPSAILSGDLNGDGKLDLVVPTQGYDKSTGIYTGTLVTLAGNGDGTFQNATETSFQVGSGAVIAGDFNGDGRLDLALGQYVTGGPYSLLSIYLQTNALVQPGVLSLPPTLLGKMSTKTATVTNVGAGPLSVTQVALAGTNAGEFSVTSDGCTGTTVPAGGSCAVAASFSPVTEGAATATLSITDSAVGSPQTITLMGGATVLITSPARLDFGSVKVGKASASQVIKVTNTTKSSVPLKGVFVFGNARGDFAESNGCERSLNPRESCSIVLQFAPTKKGMRKADVSVGVNAKGANPKSVPVSGAGI